jgi:hypothetical protein
MDLMGMETEEGWRGDVLMVADFCFYFTFLFFECTLVGGMVVLGGKRHALDGDFLVGIGPYYH